MAQDGIGTRPGAATTSVGRSTGNPEGARKPWNGTVLGQGIVKHLNDKGRADQDVMPSMRCVAANPALPSRQNLAQNMERLCFTGTHHKGWSRISHHRERPRTWSLRAPEGSEAIQAMRACLDRHGRFAVSR